MSSGWVRDSVVAAPFPFDWKLCFSVVAWTIWLAASAPVVVLPALAPTELEPVLGLLLGLEVELEPELEHPAVPSRPAATTVTPSQVAVRRLKMFMRRVVPQRYQPITQRS
jgi:hypothetical protein